MMMTARIVTAKGRPSARRAAGTMTSVRNVRGPAMSSAIRAAAKSRMEIMNTSGEGTGNMTEAPERIWVWPHFDGWITGQWSANTYHDERTIEYVRADIAILAKKGELA